MRTLIVKPLIALLLARTALSFDRMQRARGDEEEAATRLIRALQRARGLESRQCDEDLASEIRKAAETFIDAARARRRAWPAVVRRRALAASCRAYRLALDAAEAEDCVEPAEASIGLLLRAHPDLRCEVPVRLLDALALAGGQAELAA